MLQWINTFPLFPSPKKPWQSHSASKVDTCSCVRVHVCVFLCVSKPPRPNKRLPASVKAFHAPGFQLLSRLRDYFLLSIFIWFFFFFFLPPSYTFCCAFFFFPQAARGGGTASSFSSSLIFHFISWFFGWRLFSSPHLTVFFFPGVVCLLNLPGTTKVSFWGVFCLV